MSPSDDIASFQDALRKAKQVAILAGAGLSAASGIPTYRGKGGIWHEHDHDKVASLDGFKKDPAPVWQFHHWIKQVCLAASVNDAHRVLASLSLPEVRGKVLSGLKDPSSPPLLITQNMDGLSSLALDSLKDQLSPEDMHKAKHERLVEMHGNIYRQTCLQCRHTSVSTDCHLADQFAGSTVQSNTSTAELASDQLPRCGGSSWNGSNRYGKCGGPLRPAVVWFGEIPEGMGDIGRYLNWTDMLIVIGTSAIVQPAAGFIKTVKDRGGKVAFFNLEKVEKDQDADWLFLGRCEETLPLALGLTNTI
ncbi:sirtuin [Agrocybe pediades]|nr:sirtuin [Agrocybe pediades]